MSDPYPITERKDVSKKLRVYVVDDGVSESWVSAYSKAHALIVLLDSLGCLPRDLDYVSSPPDVRKVPKAEAVEIAVVDDDGENPRSLWVEFLEHDTPAFLGSTEW